MKRGCDLLILIFTIKDQKIAACRSSYRGMCWIQSTGNVLSLIVLLGPLALTLAMPLSHAASDE
ncbi:hypothetical protein A9HBioS_2799 [Pseudomonas koreensis]|uniref:Uncharacterized protein n=1 Tax=Pseudomonas koreensis TaxID=198620 RepID=A0AA94EMW7_9PSED|nr:hypothetical protein A9HBioS_2799 [Pseudomonas koreensis]